MKKLRNLKINHEKIINNVELVKLQGGYDGACSCICYAAQGYFVLGGMAATSREMCADLCSYTWNGDAYGVWSC